MGKLHPDVMFATINAHWEFKHVTTLGFFSLFALNFGESKTVFRGGQLYRLVKMKGQKLKFYTNSRVI